MFICVYTTIKIYKCVRMLVYMYFVCVYKRTLYICIAPFIYTKCIHRYDKHFGHS